MTAQTISANEIPYSWIRSELVFDKKYRRGHKGKKVRIIQEWLSFNGFLTGIDGDFGPATEKTVRQFQKAKGFNPTGVVDEGTFRALVKPMLRALTPIAARSKTYNNLVLKYARLHLAGHPIEIGGQNCGPWVRLYMKGNEGKDWPWCAGFVCFILDQAARTMGTSMPFKSTFSCDVLADRTKTKGLFVSETNLKRGNPSRQEMPPGSVFLVRRIPGDWTHTGIVTSFDAETFATIEGNTNDEGSREGFEVCARTRGYTKRDFIRIG